MKKIISLVVALVLVLVAVSALAGPSKTNADLEKVESDYVTASDKTYDGVEKLIEDLMEKEGKVEGLPEEVKAALPEDVEVETVDEVVTLAFTDEEIKEYPLIINMQFGTNYTGKTVVMVVGALNDKGEVDEWLPGKEQTGNKDGTLDLVLTEADVNWLAGRDYVVLVLE